MRSQMRLLDLCKTLAVPNERPRQALPRCFGGCGMSVAVIDAAVYPYLAKHSKLHTAGLYGLMVGKADKEGVLTIGMGKLCAGIRRSKATVLRQMADLERLGLVQRVDGGYKGRCVTYVVKRWLSDKTAFYAERGRRAAYAARRRRWNLATALKRERKKARSVGIPKGRMDATPLSPSKAEGEGWALSGAPPAAADSVASWLAICNDEIQRAKQRR